MKIGFGYDIHPLQEGRNLILGGQKINYKKGLAGHSDADVLIHAVMDALLGAAGLGDLGMHFPDTNPRLENISSMIMLSHVVTLLKKVKYKISNIDATVVLENPKIADYYPKMKKNLSSILKISESNINIKATTNEKMGPVGREEGIAAFCVVLIEKIV